jgi:hypothetical protein
MTSYFVGGIRGAVLIGGFNAINWGPILLGSFSFRSVRAIVVSAMIGFALPALGHATLDLASDPQSAIALPFLRDFLKTGVYRS